MEKLTLQKFEEAAEKVKEVTLQTNLVYSEYFSAQSGNKVYLKPENMQYTGAYKVRGAYYKISTMSEEERKKGLITASAGNHAQGVAYAAKKYGVKATVVMPTTTPLIKVNRTKDYGALSLAVQYYARPRIVLNVPASCFMPRPNVDSAVIKLERYEKPPVDVADEHLMFRIIRASFNQRRKTMMNSVGNSGDINVSKEKLATALEKCGLPLTIRGEALTLEQFAQIANAIVE